MNVVATASVCHRRGDVSDDSDAMMWLCGWSPGGDVVTVVMMMMSEVMGVIGCGRIRWVEGLGKGG